MLRALLLSALVLAGTAAAQTPEPPPRTFGFSGVLDHDGATATGPVDLALRLYSALEGGEPIYAETHAGVGLAEGVFFVEVGGGEAAAGTFAEVAFDRPYWLEVEVEGETLSPRTPLLAAPFASSVYGLRVVPSDSDTMSVVLGHSSNAVEAGGAEAAESADGTESARRALFGPRGATIGGGARNKVSAEYGTIAGGYNNGAGEHAFVGGGWSNAAGKLAAVGGGLFNHADGTYDVVGGGNRNRATGGSATVGGGAHNTASGGLSTVPGGIGNDAAGLGSFAAGSLAGSLHDGTFVWSHTPARNLDFFSSTGPDQFLIRARGGVGIGTNAPTSPLTVHGSIEIDGSGNGLVFPDGSTQTTAATGSGSGWLLGGNAGTSAPGNFLGTTDAAPFEIRVHGQRAFRLEPAGLTSEAPTILGGHVGNGAQNLAIGGTVAGGGNGDGPNRITGNYGAIGGGFGNTAHVIGTVGGGEANLADAQAATVGGGRDNRATASAAAIGGGEGNRASGESAAVGGGALNHASGFLSAIPGGGRNRAGGAFSVASGQRAVVRDATASGDIDGDEGTFVWADSENADFASTGPDQFLIRARGGVAINTNRPSAGAALTVNGILHSTAGGVRFPDGSVQTSAAGTSGGGFWTFSGNALEAGQFLGSLNPVPLELRAHNTTGLRILPAGGPAEAPTLVLGDASNQLEGSLVGAAIGGGSANTLAGSYSTIAGGQDNRAGGVHVAVGGGRDNRADGTDIVISGGSSNRATGPRVTVGGGGNNEIALAGEGEGATIAGGIGNQIQGTYGTIGGGLQNRATGATSTVPGGAQNTASGEGSFAAGTVAQAVHDGAWVWADFSNPGLALASTAPNQVSVRAAGGTRIFSDPGAATGVLLAPGAGSWTSASSVHLKTAFAPITPSAVLAGVVGLDLQTWRYRAEGADVTHLGPTSQDFAAAFGLGATDEGIATVDADGVALAAIQGLHELLQAQRAELEALRAEVAALRARR